MKSLNYLVGHILYWILKTILRILLKKHKTFTDNSPVRMYVNKIVNRLTFKIKTGYKLELLMPKTMKLFGSTTSKITKDKNGKKVPNLEITEAVLVSSV